MKALDRKLLRDLWHTRSQVLTIAFVVAGGMGAFIASFSTYDSLQWSRHVYYQASRFGEVFAALKRAPAPVESRIAELPGVSEVETTVVFDVTLDLPGVNEPVIGRMIGLPDGGQPRMNRLALRHGRFLESGGRREVLVSEGFAAARKLGPGDRLAAILNGKRQELQIVGVVLSPEYVFATRGSSLPDDRSFGVLWIDRERLASAFDMEGAFNYATARLSPGASEAAVIAGLDRLLEPYGVFGAYGRADQISNRILSQEISQQQVWGTVLPAIFMAVAAFLVNVVLSRHVATQREAIAALKALGYSNLRIGAHYLAFVSVIVVIGVALGVALGWWLGRAMTGLYTDFFHFPRLIFRVQPWVPALGAAISFAAAVGGALNTVRGIAALAPAEAMRPPSPVQYRKTLLERMGMERWLSPAARMVVRTLERRPFRAAFTSFGIACSVAIIISGTFWRDVVDYMIDVQFNAVEREDASVVLTDPREARVRHELAELPGVVQVEAAREVPVRLRAGHRTYRTGIIGLSQHAALRRLLDRDLRDVPLPGAGVLLTDRLAERLGLKPGDVVRVESLEGTRVTRDVVVAGVVADVFGMSAYMDINALNRLMGEGPSVSSLAVSVAPDRADTLYTGLKERPRVATVTVKASALKTFEETSARNIIFFTGVITIFAAAIAVGVVYNSARIALAERAWELASLRVLGFTRGEVSLFLLGELALELIAAIPLGLLLGYGLAAMMIELMHDETFAMPLIIAPRTYAFSALAIVIAGIASALVVRHRVDHLDLVAVLKTRE
ncbi:MAG: ABC transporter permease [Nitrospirota bacterium]